jgi:LytS/YehU family sensor histidine kinase
VLIHVGAWAIALFFPFLLSSVTDDYKIGPLPGLYFVLQGIPHIIIFYVNAFFLYPQFLNRTYWFVYAGAVVLLIMLSYAMKLYILAWWFPDALQEARSHILFPSLMVLLASVFYSIAVERIRAEKHQKESKAIQVEMELKFLRSQISPHFLFNILTNLVFLARIKSDQLEASLLMLSSLMRYMLNDAGKKITMKQEVEYLESYVSLQKLRFGSDVNITFNIEVSPHEINRTIEPMLLIPFVENAFKHGTGYVNQPSIDIELILVDSVLIFKVKNKYDYDGHTSKDESSGIGLSNVSTRLALLYPNRHNLVIQSDNNVFSVELTLNLL